MKSARDVAQGLLLDNPSHSEDEDHLGDSEVYQRFRSCRLDS